jgi:hypothetical protein
MDYKPELVSTRMKQNLYPLLRAQACGAPPPRQAQWRGGTVERWTGGRLMERWSNDGKMERKGGNGVVL